MTTGTEIIAGVSVAHQRASVDAIERVCTHSQQQAVAVLCETPGVSEAFVLQTCNRAEAYVVATDESTAADALTDYVGDVDPAVVRSLGHEESLRHLMRIACGLESLVVGEDQIIGQVREAYEDARSAGGIGPTLDDAVLKAIHVGERARDETAINDGVVSLGSAAVQLARSQRELAGATALVVGAGEMATVAAKALDDAVDRVIIANRTVPHAEHVAAELDGEAAAVGLAALPAVVSTADVVVTATASSDPVLDRDVLAAAGETLVVDIAQPRDVAPAASAIEEVTVSDLDDIESVTDDTRRRRREAAAAVESIIDAELDQLVTQYKRKRADQIIAAMYEGAERVKARELETAVSKLEAADGLSDEQRAIVEAMADALVKQLLAAPTRSLRDAAENDDWSTINTALQLFGSGFEPAPVDTPAGPDVRPEDIPPEMRQQVPRAVLERLAADDD